LPLIGAPRPVVAFKVNGSSALVVRLAKPDPGRLEEARTLLIEAGVNNPEPTGRPEPRTAQIEVGVRNPSSFERIDRALVNFLLPVGLLRKKTDVSGVRSEEGGQWLPTEDRVAGRSGAFDYWSQDGVDFAAGSSAVMFFEATFDEPGEYPIRIRISAPALYEQDYDTDATIRVEVGEDGPVEKITDVIAQAAPLRGRIRNLGERDQRVAVMDFMAAARLVVEAEYPDGTAFLSAPTAHEGPGVGIEYNEALLRDDAAGLYVIRRRLGEAEDSA
jgi:hypothetical protein